MARQQTDSEDSLKRQARRRLIGAVALVTAVVIILPMILEREPKPTGQNIDLRIPDKDKAGGFTSQMVLPEENASAPAPGEAAATAAAPTPSAPAAKPAPAKPPVAKPAQHKPAHKPKPAPAKPVHKAAPVAAPVTAPAKAEQPAAGFAVQVGAFANADSAKELQDKLLKQGLHAYTEKAGDNVRVRVGNYPTREDAEKVLHQLEAQGMQPAVVNVP
jgi:DedD protein